MEGSAFNNLPDPLTVLWRVFGCGILIGVVGAVAGAVAGVSVYILFFK